MLLQRLDLTSALRPTLTPDETLLFVQNGVGLYDGKQKIADLQNGHVYLTSHRLCYVDEATPRELSIVLALSLLDHCEFYAGFFKSSPKIALFPKVGKTRDFDPHGTSSGYPSGLFSSSDTSQHGPQIKPDSANSFASRKTASATRPITWICPVCSISNQLPTGFDLNTANAHSSTPPCLNCGVKPDFTYILKIAIANASGSQTSVQESLSDKTQSTRKPHDLHPAFQIDDRPGFAEVDLSTQECPRCTYLNHISVLECEICGYTFAQSLGFIEGPERDTQGLRPLTGGGQVIPQDLQVETLRLSFRAGGEKIFFEKLKGALIQRKWLLHSAPPIPEPAYSSDGSVPSTSDTTRSSKLRVPSNAVGIAGLESRGFAITKSNETMLSTAFSDLDALMASAKEVIALAEKFAARSQGYDAQRAGELIAETASGLDMVTTKDMLGQGAQRESLYLAELSRHLAEYLTDEKRGILKHEGGIMTLVDLWAVFNRSRGGIELVSPSDFGKAANLWGELKLPVRMRQFRSGLLLVQHSDRTDENTINQLLTLIESLRTTSSFSTDATAYNISDFGASISAQVIAQKLGWSVGVANEELAIAEEYGALCRDDGAEGIKYWRNLLVEDDAYSEDEELVLDGSNLTRQQEEHILQSLRDTGLL